MIDDIHTDKIALRASITASLERLLSQNYISRNGDTYAFLTDEEQDIAIDIKNTPVDSAQIVQSISQTVYGEIYPAKKYKYGKYDFAYDQYVDETLNGRVHWRNAASHCHRGKRPLRRWRPAAYHGLAGSTTRQSLFSRQTRPTL